MLYKLKKLDWTIISIICLFAYISLISLKSSNETLFFRQLIWYGVAFTIIFFGSQLNWNWIRNEPLIRYGLYWGSVALLVFANLQSETIRGTKGWIVIGGFQFEPAELAKIAIIFILAHFFRKKYIEAWVGKNIAKSFMYCLIPAALSAIHPDFGAASIMIAIWVGFLLLTSINKKRLGIGLLLGIASLAIIWAFFLKPYQKERITGFLLPESDPLGVNYNVIQSKIAIGSAGLWGKGFGEGTQTQFHFLPEAETDFIFAAFVEEWGIVSGLMVVVLYIILMYRIIRIGIEARNNESKFISLGAGVVILVQFFINVGSNLGLVPVTGITLPFISYGGSSILTNSILVSIIQNIKIESSK